MAPRATRRTPNLDRHALPLGVARLGGRPLMASRLAPADVATLREARYRDQLECVTCRRAVRVGTHEGAPCFFHTARTGLSHDPETITHHHAVRALGAHIGELFGSARIARSEPFEQLGYIADLAAVSGHGLRLAAEVQEHEITREQFERITAGLEDDGIAVLWLRSPRLLRLTGARGRPTRRMTIGEVETAILAQGRTLMYLAPDQAALAPAPGTQARTDTAPVGERIPKLLVVEPHPAAMQLALAGERRVGQVEVALRRYPLSQLRVQRGELCVLTDYDPDPPVFGEPSAAIARKLAAHTNR